MFQILSRYRYLCIYLYILCIYIYTMYLYILYLYDYIISIGNLNCLLKKYVFVYGTYIYLDLRVKDIFCTYLGWVILYIYKYSVIIIVRFFNFIIKCLIFEIRLKILSSCYTII